MLMDPTQAAQAILAGQRLFLAAEESLLRALPRGQWIGGTIPYFMAETGGLTSREVIYATQVPPEVTACALVVHDVATLPSLCTEAPENGFTFLILPATSQVHLRYAQDAPNFEGMYMKPIIGWISGVHLEDLGKVSPKVVNGETGEVFEDRAVAMHCTLPPGYQAQIGIVNLFEPGDGDTLTFEEAGFAATTCRVNGEARNLAEYLTSKGVDTKLPLVADFSGVMVNVSFQAVNAEEGKVLFYAPVFTGMDYKVARPVEDYVTAFQRALPAHISASFSCNCILNYLYSSLEGKVTEGMAGPITFGEIAYQLLNQTLVYLTIGKV